MKLPTELIKQGLVGESLKKLSLSSSIIDKNSAESTNFIQTSSKLHKEVTNLYLIKQSYFDISASEFLMFVLRCLGLVRDWLNLQPVITSSCFTVKLLKQLLFLPISAPYMKIQVLLKLNSRSIKQGNFRYNSEPLLGWLPDYRDGGRV